MVVLAGDTCDGSRDGWAGGPLITHRVLRRRLPAEPLLKFQAQCQSEESHACGSSCVVYPAHKQRTRHCEGRCLEHRHQASKGVQLRPLHVAPNHL